MNNHNPNFDDLYCMKPGDANVESIFHVLTRKRDNGEVSDLEDSIHSIHYGDDGESDEPTEPSRLNFLDAPKKAAAHDSGSLDVSTSALVHQMLEDDMENQSIFYRWTTSKIMVPTVTHMGRKLRADGAPQPQQKTRDRSPVRRVHSNASSKLRRGVSFDSTGDDSSEPDEFQEYLMDLSSSDFSQLKEKLKQQRHTAGLCTRDALRTVAPKKRSSTESEPTEADEPEETILKSQWDRQLANMPKHEEAVENEELPSCSECIHCALHALTLKHIQIQNQSA